MANDLNVYSLYVVVAGGHHAGSDYCFEERCGVRIIIIIIMNNNNSILKVGKFHF